MRTREKIYVVCPECGKSMSAHALLCRECYKRSGGVGADIYYSAHVRGESSPRSSDTRKRDQKRSYHKLQNQTVR